MTQVATPGYGQAMSPNQPKTPPRQIRIGDIWYDFDAAAKAMDTERAALIREFIDWYIREPGAKLPSRPDRNVVEGDRLARARKAALESTHQPGNST